MTNPTHVRGWVAQVQSNGFPMKSVLQQLYRWRFRERLIRVAWGTAQLLAVVGTVLAVACLTDWLIDRYSGSEAWRNFFRWSRSFAPSDPLSAGETPFWFRVLMTLGQLGLAGVLVYYLIVRPWVRTPPVDDLATTAEKAFPAFDHRLVTAIQLNRETADTRGMSTYLIAEVTREAGEIASNHRMLSLVDYRRLLWALLVIAPAALIWGIFAANNSSLAGILVKRQALQDLEIPRNIHLQNVTTPLHPTGAEVTVRFKVTGEHSEDMVGVLRVVPISTETKDDGTVVEENQPPEYYDLTFDQTDEKEPGTAFFITKLPPSSRDFNFMARLGEGRTRTPGRVSFEPPPQLATETDEQKPLTARQVLPLYLGLDPEGHRYDHSEHGNRGDVIDALPQSDIIVEARFNKPIAKGKAELTPIEREGIHEHPLRSIQPQLVADDRLSATFVFPTTPKMIGYAISLVDDNGFVNPTQIRRNIRMWDDRPPLVEFKPESTRNPDPSQYDGGGNPKDYEWDMPLSLDGVITGTYSTRSEVGIRAANIRYRVVPKGVQFDQYPEEYKRIQHPREDPNLIVYDRLPLTRFVIDPKKPDLGPFVPDLGLFTFSFKGVSRYEKNRVNIEFYPFSARNPQEEPSDMEAGGRRNFEVAGLLKKMPDKLPDGTPTTRTEKIAIGDTVELYIEVYDKVAVPLLDKNGIPQRDKNGNPSSCRIGLAPLATPARRNGRS